jgi:prepilin-type N-terminal cleavage/methylation domain-containing protein
MNGTTRGSSSKGVRQKGFTLLEVTIGILVFSLVMGGMYMFLRQANRASSKAFTRQELMHQSNLITKQLQEDFRVAASAAISLSPNQSEVQLVQKIQNAEAKITYRWNKPRLVRKAEFDGKTTLKEMSHYMDTFAVEKKMRPVVDENDMTKAENEQVVIKLEMTAPVAGSPKPMTVEQHVIATMREVASLKYDPHWRNVGDMKGAFSAYGNLLDSLQSDAELMIEDIGATIDKLVEDVENFANDALDQNTGNLLEAKNNIDGALKDVAKGKVDLDKGLNDLETNMESIPEDIFERELGEMGTWLGDKGDAKDRVAKAFFNMKTVEDCDVKKLEDAADPFKLNDAFRQMLKSKKEALENKVKMGANETKLNELLGEVKEKLASTGG